MIDGDIVVPESNVINEYLDDRFPEHALMPAEPFGRAKVRLWTKQLDEGVHDAGIAVISFALAFRHQYLKKGQAGQATLESIPDPIKRERRRDVIDNGLDSAFFKIAILRMLELYDDMEAQLATCSWLVDSQYTIADAALTPYVVRLDHLDILGLLDGHPRVLDWYNRLKNAPKLPKGNRGMGESRISDIDAATGKRQLAQGASGRNTLRVICTTCYLAVRAQLRPFISRSD